MPTLTITLAQPIVDRILASNVGNNVAEVEAWIKAALKSEVITFESNEAANAVHETVKDETW